MIKKIEFLKMEQSIVNQDTVQIASVLCYSLSVSVCPCLSLKTVTKEEIHTD